MTAASKNCRDTCSCWTCCGRQLFRGVLFSDIGGITALDLAVEIEIEIVLASAVCVYPLLPTVSPREAIRDQDSTLCSEIIGGHAHHYSTVHKLCHFGE